MTSLPTASRRAAENDVDLVAKQSEATRDAILQAAARRFAERGYEKTRVSDICRDVGVTAQLLYSHFPSKRHLFIACWRCTTKWMNAEVVASHRGDRPIPPRVWPGGSGRDTGIQAFSPDLQAMARVEAFHPESELRPLVREVYEKMLARNAAGARRRAEGRGQPRALR